MLPLKRCLMYFLVILLPVFCVAQPAITPNIAGVVKDTLIIATGSTYRYTVDTPEGSGLVSTAPTIASLTAQVMELFPAGTNCQVETNSGTIKTGGELENGDFLIVTTPDHSGKPTRLFIQLRQLALNGSLKVLQRRVTTGSKTDFTVRFTAGQRSPNATVRIWLPFHHADLGNITVNVIGRGAVPLEKLSQQSIGRTGNKYSYSKVGTATVQADQSGNTLIKLSGLDLRPANGADIELKFNAVIGLKTFPLVFRSNYAVTAPVALNSYDGAAATDTVYPQSDIADFKRVPYHATTYSENGDAYSRVYFQWTPASGTRSVQLQFSTDKGSTWRNTNADIDMSKGKARVTGLNSDQLYIFRLLVNRFTKSYSNSIRYFSGKIPATNFGIDGDPAKDYTKLINLAIDSLHRLGGGTLYFEKGWFNVRTVHLKSNVFLYVGKQATIAALRGGDAPETTWFSDKKYRSGLSPTDPGPYDDPENYMTKQDVGHHYFRNCMFFAEREDNIRIIGNGRITGNGNLVTGDKVMNNAADNRSDKMFTFKLCTNIEIGGLNRNEDLWYNEKRDEPYYILPGGKQDTALDNMLHIDQGGHFVLLATGTDQINVHDTYFGKANGKNARDIYDFMACNNVRVNNIYSKVSSDDIVKPGSDCSLGFTRPARIYTVRNVIGDTNCNLFQIGSETADDIQDICVDNIYVLGANKAGFSISTNDGGHVKNIHLNCGHTGTLHSRSKMLRTFTPFFISISNRARILGAEAAQYAFTENGEKHKELLIKNVNIGKVENILINGIDIGEVYAGSSYSGNRWKEYDGKQRRATAIVAGYALPHSNVVEGGLDFKLPNGLHTGYIKNIQFNDVHILVKGSNPISDTSANPPELGVGQYNASNLKIQPAYGLWARHARDLQVKNSSFNFEESDQRYAIFLDDVQNAGITNNEMVLSKENPIAIAQRGSSGLNTGNNKTFGEEWKKKDLPLSGNRPKQPAALEPPPETGQKQQ